MLGVGQAVRQNSLLSFSRHHLTTELKTTYLTKPYNKPTLTRLLKRPRLCIRLSEPSSSSRLEGEKLHYRKKREKLSAAVIKRQPAPATATTAATDLVQCLSNNRTLLGIGRSDILTYCHVKRWFYITLRSIWGFLKLSHQAIALLSGVILYDRHCNCNCCTRTATDYGKIPASPGVCDKTSGRPVTLSRTLEITQN